MTFVLVMVLWVFSVCLHEFGHAVAAFYGGDTSVKDKGYLSLDPMRYVDPMTSILLPLVFLAMGGIGLPGGAVYIDHSRIRSKLWEITVSLAGPLANLVIAAVLGVALALDGGQSTVAPAIAFLVWLQVSAVILNLLPIPPLDGYNAIAPMLPYETRKQLDTIAPIGLLLVFALFAFMPGFSTYFSITVTKITQMFGVPFWLIKQGFNDFFFWKL